MKRILNYWLTQTLNLLALAILCGGLWAIFGEDNMNEKPLDQVSALQLQAAVKDIRLAEQQKVIADQAIELANLRAQRVLDGFLYKNGMKPDDWQFDQKGMKYVAKPKPETPKAK